MATGDIPFRGNRLAPALAFGGRASVASDAWALLRVAGSLKITVVMFLAATFLLFVGTLAQDEKNLPEVKAEYFNSWVAKVPLSDFFPVTIFGEFTLRDRLPWSLLPAWFPFPGGATIGVVLLVNLVAAKATRFHVAARGQRLVWGLVVTLLGGLLTAAVIRTGHRTDGLQGQPPVDYGTVWGLVQAGGAVLAAGLAAAAFAARTGLARGVAATAAAGVALVVWMTFVGGDDWRMNEPGLRIMWQLLQSSLAALVLLAGLIMVFGARGGNVLIHLAVGMLMVGQFAFGDRQIEERMTLVEGQSTDMACRTDEVELAVIDTGSPDADHVTAISSRLLRARVGGEPIPIEGLPFEIAVVAYLPNSDVQEVKPGEPNQATAGRIGQLNRAVEKPPEGGASSGTNVASAYVRLVERDGTGGGRDLGTYLVTQYVNDRRQLFVGMGDDASDTVTAGGRDWRLQLRFRREYKPYTVTLDDVRRINYSASETPRDYSSYVTFTDKATGTEQRGQRIWMNNPVRYQGETFYQSTYSEVDLGEGRTGEMTGLQVVENAGWLVPYVACVLAFWGMLVHFGGTFLRFADRHERAARAERNEAVGPRPSRHVVHAAPPAVRHEPRFLLGPALALGLVAAVAISAAWPRRPAGKTADWAAAGALPVMHEGRVKPLDSVARQLLQLLGGRTSVRMPEDAPGEGPHGRVSASQWLLGTMAGSAWTDQAPVFRIDAKEVVDFFDLARRPGHRYSAAELEPKRAALRQQVQALRDVPREAQSFVQRKFVELEQKLNARDLVRFAYEAPPLPQMPEGDDEQAKQAFLGELMQIMQMTRMLEENHPPAAVPPVGRAAADAAGDPASRWQALEPALVNTMVAKLLSGRPGQPEFRPNPALVPFARLLEAVDRDGAEFDAALDAYRKAAGPLPEFRDSVRRAGAEAWFNAFNPTDLAKWLYVAATVLCFTAFLGWQTAWRHDLARFTWWLLAGTFLLHSFALGMRIWLTGRPPVVNLYSSAVFIGWACVLAGLGLERLHRLGIGSLVAAVSGALTLMVAYGLESGDTMHVLQAVLDTQFWLSTHVITVTLGYGATFLAGSLGTCSIVHRLWADARGTSATAAARDVQDRLFLMNYGVVCFALFFSFIGTVLGGLWADDSWGRFWGWDPKENGALMIVLWNAAVLHARWDRWIGPRGFALFTIGGNVVTAWSWFGTNQLGIGLHSYGFTSGVLMLLGAYVVSQLLLIAAGATLTSSARAASAA